MDIQALIRSIAIETPSRIVLLVVDGLGGLPRPEDGRSELEAAQTPHLDELARHSSLGLSQPVAPGITPGSGLSHLALFGYDPFVYGVGRGVLEAMGIDFPLRQGDVAVRGNLCTVNDRGIVTDRRAGRPPTEVTAEVCAQLRQIAIPGVEIFVEPVREHRFVLVLRGANLSAAIDETDPSRDGFPPRPATALSPAAATTAAIVREFIERARAILHGHERANMILLRGFSQAPDLPTFGEVYKLRAAAIATYPMYRGLAQLLGITLLPSGSTIADEFAAVRDAYADYTFFYIHFKRSDSAGEDGDFAAKVAAIEQVDAALPTLLDLKPDVLVVTGDHSTPAMLKGHSWHPVPLLLHSANCWPEGAAGFSERACARGFLGTFPAVNVMPLAMANAMKLSRYGA